ncbi:YoaK family protein [Citromicrobium bathyomarinum]|uniref:YoaK family protein n=1 Tax=Citromicrobium bathyomarinum TaxID=72174 RepID=UPI00315AF770
MITRKQAVFTLNFVAGWVDAVGFLALVGSVRAFPSFMSGNSTKVVTDLVSGKPGLAGLVAGVVLVFILGTVLSRLINDGTRWRETTALAAVAGVLCLAGAGVLMRWDGYALLLLLALGMGMINRALQGKNGFTVHTFVSGAVVTIGSDIADAISGRGDWKQALLPLNIWGAILSGAFFGSILTLKIALVIALLVPAALVSLLAVANGARWLEEAGDARDGHLDAIETHG